MLGKFFVGPKVSQLDIGSPFERVSRVTLVVDGENRYTAGDDTGRAIEKNLPWATQAMAESVLRSLQGVVYRPFSGVDALLDPAAEVGDGITVGGIYSTLAKADITFDRLYTADIAAPDGDEVEDEYPYKSRTRRQEERKLSQINSRITKTAEQILLQVESVSGEVNSLAITLDGVTIAGPSGETLIKGSSVRTKDLVVDAANITGRLTASQIDASSLKVDAANITGSLTIGQLPSNVATDSDIPQSTSQLINDSGYQTESGVTTIIDGTVTADYLNALGVSAKSLTGRYVYLNDSNGTASGVMSITSAVSGGYAVDITSYSAMRLSANSGNVFLRSGYGPWISLGRAGYGFDGIQTSGILYSNNVSSLGLSGYPWSAVYANTGEIITSDENRKHDIEPLPDKYLDMLDLIEPFRFKMDEGTSDRYHVGFIAQRVKEAMDKAGVDSKEFAGWCADKDESGNDIYMLRYEEFIALLWAKIKRLEEEIHERGAKGN